MGVLEMAKAGAAAIPGAGLLPFLPGGGGEIPEMERSLEPAAADLDRLAAYSQVCGFTLRNELPVTWPHICAFDLHMQIVTDGRFPFGPMGLVHIRNEITQYRPIGVNEKVALSTRTSSLTTHPKGRAFSLVSEARIGDELVWKERSTMLKRGGSSSETEAPGEGDETVEEGEADKTGERAHGADDRGRDESGGSPPIAAWWQLPGDLGARYGAVSGDRNPIHMHWLTAKPLGFPGAIAHGMWTKARCLAALAPLLPNAFTVSVTFGKPVVLPTRVGFSHMPGERPGDLDFAVLPARGRSTHMTGSIRTADHE